MRKYYIKDSSYWQRKNRDTNRVRSKRYRCDWCHDRILDRPYNIILTRLGGKRRSMLVDVGCLLYFQKYFKLTWNTDALKVFHRDGSLSA